MTPLCKDHSLILWGTVTQDAKTRVFDNGKIKTSFSMRYHTDKDEDGAKISKYMEVEAWGNLARYASGIERGDDVMVAGEYLYDKYMSEKKGEDRYKLSASIIFVQPVAEEAEEYDAPAEQAPAADPASAFKESAEEDDGELPF